MCANFKKAFKKGDVSIPSSILKQLEKDLPNGFQYKSLNNGTCIVVPDDISKIIKKDSFIIPEGLEGKNIDEILQYAYSSQEPLEFKSTIHIDGESFKVVDMVKFPFSAKKESLGTVSLLPSPFEEIQIELEGYGVKKDIIVKRQPSKDVSKMIFKRIDSDDIEFAYIFNLEKSKIDMNINVNFDRCKSIEELIDNLKLYKAFGDGNLIVAGINMASKYSEFKVNMNKAAIDDMIGFYDKLLKITRLINIDIRPKESIDKEDIYSVEELYRTLIDNQPYKEYVNIDKLNIVTTKELDEDTLPKGKECAFQSSCNGEWNILGQSITLPTIIVIYDIVVTDIRLIKRTKNIEYELDIINVKGRKTYKSSMHFKDEEAHEEYLKNISNVVEELKNSMEIIL